MAFTLTNRDDVVVGNKRMILLEGDIGADADTYVTGLHRIDSANFSSPTNNAIGCTYSGGTLTFQTGGAEAGVRGQIIGI